MKHKVSELEGPLLDAAVAKALGYELDADGDNLSVRENGGGPSAWHPSTDWSHGGPLIERYGMRVWTRPGEPWRVEVLGTELGRENGGRHYAAASGQTLLIAAMRAFVASKFGAEVDLP